MTFLPAFLAAVAGVVAVACICVAWDRERGGES